MGEAIGRRAIGDGENQAQFYRNHPVGHADGYDLGEVSAAQVISGQPSPSQHSDRGGRVGYHRPGPLSHSQQRYATHFF
jgi:lipoate-protein ligase B